MGRKVEDKPALRPHEVSWLTEDELFYELELRECPRREHQPVADLRVVLAVRLKQDRDRRKTYDHPPYGYHSASELHTCQDKLAELRTCYEAKADLRIISARMSHLVLRFGRINKKQVNPIHHQQVQDQLHGFMDEVEARKAMSPGAAAIFAPTPGRGQADLFAESRRTTIVPREEQIANMSVDVQSDTLLAQMATPKQGIYTGTIPKVPKERTGSLQFEEFESCTNRPLVQGNTELPRAATPNMPTRTYTGCAFDPLVEGCEPIVCFAEPTYPQLTQQNPTTAQSESTGTERPPDDPYQRLSQELQQQMERNYQMQAQFLNQALNNSERRWEEKLASITAELRRALPANSANAQSRPSWRSQRPPAWGNENRAQGNGAPTTRRESRFSQAGERDDGERRRPNDRAEGCVFRTAHYIPPGTDQADDAEVFERSDRWEDESVSNENDRRRPIRDEPRRGMRDRDTGVRPEFRFRHQNGRSTERPRYRDRQGNADFRGIYSLAKALPHCRYAGTAGSDCDDFIAEIETHMVLKRISEAEIVEEVPAMLDGAARTVYLQRIRQGPIETWAEMRALIKSAQPGYNKEGHRERALHEPQGPTENIAVYMARYRLRLSQIDPPYDHDTIFNAVKQNVLPCYRFHLVHFAGTRLDQLERYLLRLEDSMRTIYPELLNSGSLAGLFAKPKEHSRGKARADEIAYL